MATGDEILEVANRIYHLEVYKREFLKSLETKDIDGEPLEKKYSKWLIKKLREEL